MLLAIDIGNTDTAFGVFKGEELVANWHISTNVHRMPDEYAVFLFTLLEQQKLERSEIKSAVLCCVVPPVLPALDEFFQRYFDLTPLVVGAGIKTGVRIRMDNPREVGGDRIVNTAAAHHLYGGPVIVVDMGTATTFDVVSKEGDYIGGVIAPGLATAGEALSMKTAMLPRVELQQPKQTIGTNTVAAMRSGLVYGYVGLVEGLVTRIRRELGEKARVVATGGYARVIAQETTIFDVINPSLTLIGLRLIHNMNKTT